MDERFPSQKTIDDLTRDADMASEIPGHITKEIKALKLELSRVEEIKSKIEELEKCIPEAIEAAEEISRQLAEAINKRADNPIDAELADTSERLPYLEKYKNASLKYTALMGTVFSVGISSGIYRMSEGNNVTGAGVTLTGLMGLAIVLKELKSKFDEVKNSKLRVDLLNEIKHQSV